MTANPPPAVRDATACDPAAAPDRAGRGRDPGRARDRSLVLVLLGCALLVSPVVQMVDLPLAPFGVPVVLLYLFAVWLLLILGAALLARSLGALEEP